MSDDLDRDVLARVRAARWETPAGIAWALRKPAEQVEASVARLLATKALAHRQEDGALVIRRERVDVRADETVRARIVRYLDGNDWQSTPEIARGTGIPIRQVSSMVARAFKLRKLRRRPSGHGGAGRSYLYSLVPGVDRLKP